MEILFQSDSDIEEEFEFDGQVMVNKGTVQIVKIDENNFETELS